MFNVRENNMNAALLNNNKEANQLINKYGIKKSYM